MKSLLLHPATTQHRAAAAPPRLSAPGPACRTYLLSHRSGRRVSVSPIHVQVCVP